MADQQCLSGSGWPAIRTRLITDSNHGSISFFLTEDSSRMTGIKPLQLATNLSKVGGPHKSNSATGSRPSYDLSIRDYCQRDALCGQLQYAIMEKLGG
ncbi:hypothetical protein ACLOJK_040500, partial [Asimina triloba]